MEKAQKDKKLESVENAYLYKPVLNKIMTTHKQYVKYNFVAPLMRLLVSLNFRNTLMQIVKF